MNDYVKAFDTAGDILIGGMQITHSLALVAAESTRQMVDKCTPQMKGLASFFDTETVSLRELTESSFRFWNRVTESHKQFTLRLLETLETRSRRTGKAE